MVAPITLWNLDPSLLERLRAEASRRAVDVETVAIDWLKRGADMTKSDAPPTLLRAITPEDRAKLLAMSGTWTKEEADGFDKRVDEMFEQIDEEMWK